MTSRTADWQNVSCLMPEELARALAQQVGREGVPSRADIIRKAVAEYLDRAALERSEKEPGK